MFECFELFCRYVNNILINMWYLKKDKILFDCFFFKKSTFKNLCLGAKKARTTKADKVIAVKSKPNQPKPAQPVAKPNTTKSGIAL